MTKLPLGWSVSFFCTLWNSLCWLLAASSQHGNLRVVSSFWQTLAFKVRHRLIIVFKTCAPTPLLTQGNKEQVDKKDPIYKPAFNKAHILKPNHSPSWLSLMQQRFAIQIHYEFVKSELGKFHLVLESLHFPVENSLRINYFWDWFGIDGDEESDDGVQEAQGCV